MDKKYVLIDSGGIKFRAELFLEGQFNCFHRGKTNDLKFLRGEIYMMI